MKRPPDPNEESTDTGTPIEVLRDFEVAPSTGFFGRLRKKIDRKVTTGSFLSLGWDAPRQVLVEFIEFLFHWFEPVNSRREPTDERPTDRSDE